MMRLLTATLCTFILTGITACGFQPLNTTDYDNANSRILPPLNISYSLPPHSSQSLQRLEFSLRQAIAQRLGSDGHMPALAHLDLHPRLSRNPIGVTTDYIDSRYDLRLELGYTLTRATDNQELLRDTLSVVTTFGAPTNAYGLNAAQEQAEKQLAELARDQLIINLATFYKTQADMASPNAIKPE